MTLLLSATTLSSAAGDTDDSDVRETPQMDFSYDEADSIPSFIKLDSNHIIMNGADWSDLSQKLAAADSNTVTIVHIGDSHIQADFATGKTRALLQSRYGSAGRGLIVPLKIAGTNEPRDYAIKSTSKWQASKLLKPDGKASIGFTGIGISPVDEKADLTIATLSRSGDAEPFSALKIYHLGKLMIDSVSSSDEAISFSATYTDSVTTLLLPSPVTQVTIGFTTTCATSIYGIVLSNGRQGGILYHAIGNNGATFHSYNMLPDDINRTGDISPDLIIVSLGANEAFSRMTGDEIYRSIDRFIANLRKNRPDCNILLTTPMECQKSVIIRRKGKKRRRSYSVNEKVATVRDIILKYAADHNVPVYDWYEVAGGTGASGSWVKEGLMAKDRIHHSYKGYRLHGSLLYDALINSTR